MKNSINLVSVVDTFLNSCMNSGYDYSLTTTDNTFQKGSYTYYPNSFNEFFETINFPTIDFKESYPPSNLYIQENGTFILEIATTGFKKDEVSVERKGTKLIVKAQKKLKDSNLKQVWHKLKIKDFELVYQCAEEIDLDKIELSMENGLLEIKMPLKEKEQPVKLEIK